MAEKMLRTLDRQSGRWVVDNFSDRMNKDDQDILLRLAQAASYAVSLKHTCVDLAVYKNLSESVLDELLDGISQTDVMRVVKKSVIPLVASADGQRIWLHKYHEFEMAVASQLSELQEQGRLEIITGGPGTGKTYTAAKRIERTLDANPACRILLAAPTGKAAHNMMVALANSGFSAEKHDLKGLTIHSLLGMNGRSPKPRRDKKNPLPCDLLIIDEASMIDLPMVCRLLQAIPSNATLLLLGDKDQLASVEAGSVLADIYARFKNTPLVNELTESRRFKDSPEISVLANSINAGQVVFAVTQTQVRFHLLTEKNPWEPAWLDQAVKGYAWIAQSLNSTALESDVADILKAQKKFQLLCALREGPHGVKGINPMIAKALGHKPDSWYAGQPVMVIHNDHHRKLYNGDVGMVLHYEGSLKACFMINGCIKAISLAQMPAFETCYAITVHKSQGSEYDHVMIVLPHDLQGVKANPVLTRELVYTAITRAKTGIDLWAGEGVLQVAAERTMQRMSGLRTFLL
jgi:exodeoxyribonuclease V alpha subunit